MKELQVHQLNDLPRLSLHANLRHLRRRSLSLVTFLRRRDLRRQHRDHLRILFERCRRCRDLQRLCLHQRRYPCSSIRRPSSSRRHPRQRLSSSRRHLRQRRSSFRRHLRQRCSSKQDRRRRNHSMALRSEHHLLSIDNSLRTQEQYRPSVRRGSCGEELSCSRLHQLLRARTEFILHRRPRYDLRPHLLGHRQRILKLRADLQLLQRSINLLTRRRALCRCGRSFRL